MFYILAISVVILSGCNFGAKKETIQEDGELVVSNQSSSEIKEIKYCGKELRYEEEGSSYTSSVLPIGKKTSIKLTSEETGYVFFTLLYGNRDVSAEVRTNEIITVEKGKRFVLTITDNTLVVETGGKDASTLIDLATPATLKIVNNSSRSLGYVTYKERYIASHTNSLGSYESKREEFYGINNHSDYVYFGFAGLNFQTEEKVTIEKGKTTTLTIADDTYVFINGKVKTRVKISEIDWHHVVLINNTSYDLHNVEFRNNYKVQLNHKDVLTKGEHWYAGISRDSFDYINNCMYLYFSVKTPDTEKIFRLYGVICVNTSTNDEIFIERFLSDDTDVVYEDKEGKLKSFLD